MGDGSDGHNPDGHDLDDDGRDDHGSDGDVSRLGYTICPDDGYLSAVLKPLVEDRDALKTQLRGEEALVKRRALRGKRSAIKWILVACFGYQGFANAKYGRIEAHEAINAFAREILLNAKATLEDTSGASATASWTACG